MLVAEELIGDDAPIRPISLENRTMAIIGDELLFKDPLLAMILCGAKVDFRVI